MLAIIDCFSKFLWLFAIPRKEASMVAECLFTVIARFGVGPPEELQSDNGTEFSNELVEDLAARFNIKTIKSAPYSPNVQGVVERQNLTIGKMLEKYKELCHSEKRIFNWSDNLVLSSICWEYNTSYHSSIKMTPFECFFGRPFPGQYTIEEGAEPEDYQMIRDRYQDAAEKAHEETRRKIARKNRSAVLFNEDEPVYARVHLDQSKRRGAFSKKTQVSATICKVYRKHGSGEYSHKYDIRDQDGKVYNSVSVSDIRVRKPLPELKIFA